MPAQVRWPTVAVLLLTVALVTVSLLALLGRADAQTAGPTVTQYPGVVVEYLGRKGETHTVVIDCPAGSFAIAGGWATVGSAAVAVTSSYPARLPGAGSGAWELTARKLDQGPVTLIPYVSCLGGVTQAPE
jgi:hypothetical protein